jgi:NAD(P)-dependent dehydrogenase (short-subunit alcohol dehydrogenase family)
MKRLLFTLGGLGVAAWTVSRLVRSDYSFAGKSVLITGGSRGLGLALARRFAMEGARLALLARDEDELARACDQIRGIGGEAIPIPCDLLDRGQSLGAIETVVDRFGTIDVLVNNAGIIEVGPLENMRRQDFDKSMNLHFWAPLNLMRQTIPHMRRAGGGRIVNISSIGGKVAVPHMVPYTASKFALVGLSDGFRAELARGGIKVTTVTPGLMRTGSQVHAKFKGNHGAEYTWFSVSSAIPFAAVDADRAAEKNRRSLPVRPVVTHYRPSGASRDRWKCAFPEPYRRDSEVRQPGPAASSGSERRPVEVRRRRTGRAARPRLGRADRAGGDGSQ